MTEQMTEAASPFTSPRERRLWMWTAIVAVAIFATLGLTNTIALELARRDQLDDTFFFAFLVLMAAIVIHGLRVRPGRPEIWIGMGIASVYVMLFLRMASPVERSHVIEYSMLALLILAALREREENGRAVWRPALLAIGAATAVGVLDEAVQLVLPFRVFDPIDIAFNTFAAVVAVTGSVALAWARRFRPRRR